MPYTETGQFTLLQLALQLFRLSSNWTQKRERDTTKEINCEPAQATRAKLLLDESHATANVSLLACWQKLPTATLNKFFFN